VLGKTLNTDIKFISLAMTPSKKPKGPEKSRDQNIVVCLGLEKLYIFREDFKTIKASVTYENIQKIIIDKLNRNKVRIDVNKIEGGQNCSNFPIILKDRGVFVKSIICYASIYYMRKYGTINEITLVQKEIHNDLEVVSLALSKGLDVVHDDPKNFEKARKNGYE